MENNADSYFVKGAGVIDEVDYARIERFNREKTEKLISLYQEVINLIEPFPGRDGIKDTPERVSRSIQYLTHGYNIDPVKMLESATFEEDYNPVLWKSPHSIHPGWQNYRTQQNRACGRCVLA
jgi:hypothetical protein